MKTMKSIKNNRLTLKQLKLELEQLKTSKSKSINPTPETHKSTVAHDIKNSYIQNLYMKSSIFMLWLVSSILAYAHKIPYISKIITILTFWYGKQPDGKY